jgi:hypothetical protein
MHVPLSVPINWPTRLVFAHRTNVVHLRRQLAELPGGDIELIDFRRTT